MKSDEFNYHGYDVKVVKRKLKSGELQYYGLIRLGRKFVKGTKRTMHESNVRGIAEEAIRELPDERKNGLIDWLKV